MLKILTSKQTKELDAYTIQHEPIASIDLMERACRAFVSWFTDHFPPEKKVGIVCGTGNNGGDGLGIARLLHEWNYTVQVWIVKGLVPESEDFKLNLQRLKGKVEINDIVSESDKRLFHECDILIDAIFGSGLSRPVEGIYAQVIQCINQTNAIRVAVDIPSGLLADTISQGEIVKAHATITFQLPKLSFLLPQNFKYVGDWHIVTIGLDKTFLKNLPSNFYYLQKKDIKKLRINRAKFDHKGDYGKALIVAGSYGKIGAAVLAAQAAIRSGLGLLTVNIPKSGYAILQIAVPEAMVSIDMSDDCISTEPDHLAYDAIGIGPGLGQESVTAEALRKLLQQYDKPVVLDADALNILAREPGILEFVPSNSILTPHLKEFERLAGLWKDDFLRLELQVEFSKKWSVITVLKGAHTCITTPGGIAYFNSTGNPGMATGGSGDVLTGLITGLLAQGLSPENAAIYGVYLHGTAGDHAAMIHGMEAMVASDIILSIPEAFKALT
jgi:ADP-dependent NAD(P)H-hydrate dehydratase / NAD(P)H-hydrate epimerase